MTKKLFVATPMYGGMCCATYTSGLLDTALALTARSDQMKFFAIGNESLITRARNELVRVFLETDYDHFIFIDADIGFKAEHVLKLLDSRKDVICGLYPKKLVDWPRINYASKMGLHNLEDYASSYVVDTVDVPNPDAPLDSSVVEIAHGGTGFMLIKRGVFEKLAPLVKEYRVSTLEDADGNMAPLTKEYFALDVVGEHKYLLSEDYFFCDLWRRNGGKVHADLSIQLVHTGTYEYRGNLLVGGANPSTHKSAKGF